MGNHISSAALIFACIVDLLAQAFKSLWPQLRYNGLIFYTVCLNQPDTQIQQFVLFTRYRINYTTRLFHRQILRESNIWSKVVIIMKEEDIFFKFFFDILKFFHFSFLVNPFCQFFPQWPASPRWRLERLTVLQLYLVNTV